MKKKHRDNLLKLAAYLETLPDDYERFDMGEYMAEGDGGDRITALGAALQAKEDGLNVRDNRIAALEAAGWALFWHADHNHQCLVRRPNGINLSRCTCGFDEVRKEWKALAGKAERERIVAYLLNEQREYPRTEYSGFAAMIAEEISAKEHLK